MIDKVSIIICTRNRGEQLAALLESLASLEVPEGVAWEVVLVDNGSTDSTPKVIQSFANKIPLIYVYEGKAGLSNARNAGLKVASGKYILWTDDDVVVTKGWISNYIKAFHEYPNAAVFGGKITPVLDAPTPEWFSANTKYLSDLLCLRDFGLSPCPLSEQNNRMPYGANFAIRSTEQKQYSYDPELGVAPGRRRGGEETDVVTKILSSGNHGWWVPTPEVKHIVPTPRQTISYIKEYYSACGETTACQWLKSGKDLVTQLLPELFFKLPLSWLRYVIFMPWGPRLYVRYLVSYSIHYGKCQYLLHVLFKQKLSLNNEAS